MNRASLAQAGYQALLRSLTPLYLARLWWRGRHEPLYRHAVGERLGWYGGPASGDRDNLGQDLLWLHAVSLGETRAAAPLVDALRARRPGLRLLLTSSTATGREAGRGLLREGDRQVWLPYDTPGAVRRFLAHFRPRLGVLMETEIWPGLLQAAHEAGVPVVLANARLSERSLRKGQRLQALLQPAMSRLTLALAQTEDDAARLREAGAPAVRVCGNLKYDMNPDPARVAQGRRWRSDWARPVVMMASSREGEEAPLLQAWQRLPSPRPLLLLVPRHPQRFDAVAALVQQAGLRLVRRSAMRPDLQADADAEVCLGDSMGEMPMYAACADVALLGGSFAPLGGQNLIELAACGCPVVMGPHTFNFEEAARLAQAAGAALRVEDIDGGVREAAALAGDEAHRPMAVQRALDFAQAHRGATERMAQAIDAAWPVSGVAARRR